MKEGRFDHPPVGNGANLSTINFYLKEPKPKEGDTTEIEAIRIEGEGGFLMVPRVNIKQHDSLSAVWLAEIIDKLRYLIKKKLVNNMHDSFYYDKMSIREQTGISLNSQTKIIKQLREKGIIEVERKDIPARYYYRINWDNYRKFTKKKD